MATTLEIVTGIAQAAANAYDGAHDERFVDGDDNVKKIGLRREEGCALNDSRVIDGFKVRMMGNMLTVCYSTEVTTAGSHDSSLASEIEGYIKNIAKFLKKEYKKITGNTLSLKDATDIEIGMQYISRRRVSIYAHQSFTIGGLDDSTEMVGAASEERLDKAVKDFLALGREKAKKPSNYTAKNEG